MIGNSYQMVSEHDLVTSVTVPRLPLFNGDDPYGWVLRIEEYFQDYQTPESKKVAVAQACLEDVAWRWFQAVEEQDPIKNWLEFRITLFNCCSKMDNDPFDELMALRYDSSVLEFWIRFIPVAAKLSDIPETFLCDIFIGNLPVVVKRKVREYKLRTLHEVIARAFFVEGQLRFQYQSSTLKELKSGNDLIVEQPSIISEEMLGVDGEDGDEDDIVRRGNEHSVDHLIPPTKMVEIKASKHDFQSELLSEKEVENSLSHTTSEIKIDLPMLETVPALDREESIFPVTRKISSGVDRQNTNTREAIPTSNDHQREETSKERVLPIVEREQPLPSLYEQQVVYGKKIVDQRSHNIMLLFHLLLQPDQEGPKPLSHFIDQAHLTKSPKLINQVYGPALWDPGKIHRVTLFWPRERQKVNRYQYQIDDNHHGWQVMKNLTTPVIALGSPELETTTVLVREDPIAMNPANEISLGQSTPWKKELRLVPIFGVGLKPSGYCKKEMRWMYGTTAPNTKKKRRVAERQPSRSDMGYVKNVNALFVCWIFDRGRKIIFQKFPPWPNLHNTILVPSDRQRWKNEILISISGNFLSYPYFLPTGFGQEHQQKEICAKVLHVKHNGDNWVSNSCFSRLPIGIGGLWVFDRGRSITFGSFKHGLTSQHQFGLPVIEIKQLISILGALSSLLGIYGKYYWFGHKNYPVEPGIIAYMRGTFVVLNWRDIKAAEYYLQQWDKLNLAYEDFIKKCRETFPIAENFFNKTEEGLVRLVREQSGVELDEFHLGGSKIIDRGRTITLWGFSCWSKHEEAALAPDITSCLRHGAMKIATQMMYLNFVHNERTAARRSGAMSNLANSDVYCFLVWVSGFNLTIALLAAPISLSLVRLTIGKNVTLLSWFFERGRLTEWCLLFRSMNNVHQLTWFFDRGRATTHVEACFSSP